MDDVRGWRWTTDRLLVALLLLVPAAPLAAQVGHRPESSPYHDIPKGHTVTPIFGQYRRQRRAVRDRSARRPGLRPALRHPHRVAGPARPRRHARDADAPDRGSVRGAGQPGLRAGGPDGDLRRGQPAAQRHRRKELASAGAVRRLGRRPRPSPAARPPTPATSSWGRRCTWLRSPESGSSSPTASRSAARLAPCFSRSSIPRASRPSRCSSRAFRPTTPTR